MNITTAARDFDMSSAIDQFVRDELRLALQRFDDSIASIDVFLKDANGPKGGIDKQVLIRVQLRNRRQILLESTHENLYAAIKQGSKRVKRAVRRSLRKSQHASRIGIRGLRRTRELATTARL